MLEDLPENAAVMLTYNSVNCKYPCHKCLIENDELNNTRLNGNEIVLRTPENMKDYVDRGIVNQYPLHNMKNIFWKYGVSAGKRDQIDKKIFFEIINVLDQMIKSTSILLRNFFLKKISIWSLFPALTPYDFYFLQLFI